MTATPAYGFRISGKPGAGPMSQAMQAGDIKGIRDVLSQRFPNLQFETLDTGLEEVDKPTETTVAPTPVADVAGEETTTASLYNDYMAGLPTGVRGLVTTDYKGVRGSRLGRGNYTTASMVPGAQVSTPAPAPAPAPSTGGGTTTTTTYNAPVVGGNWQQYYGDYYSGDVNYGTIGADSGSSSAAPAASTAPAAAPAQTTPTNQQYATQAIQQASGGGVSAAAKSTGNTGSINFAEATALMQSGLSKGEIKQRAESQGVKLTDNALRALQGKGKK